MTYLQIYMISRQKPHRTKNTKRSELCPMGHGKSKRYTSVVISKLELSSLKLLWGFQGYP